MAFGKCRFVLLLGSCLCAANTQAQDSGIYFGGTIGGRGYDNACQPEALSCERRGTAWGAFTGYRFNPRFGLELGYLDLGEAHANYPRLTGALEVTGDIDGYDFSALYAVMAGPDVRFFLRVGGFRWQAKTRSPEFAFDEEGWSASAGAGFEWHAGRHWQFRCQYLYLNDIGGEETGRANGHVGSLSVTLFIPTRQ